MANCVFIYIKIVIFYYFYEIFYLKKICLRLSLKKNLVSNLFEQLVKEDRLIETILCSFQLDQNKFKLLCDFLILN